MNFDSFGHTVGLVQILKKCGYDSYICCRPNPEMMDLPREFWWIGKELLSGGAFQPVMYEDNADPWGWYMEHIGENPVNFTLSDCKKGPFENLINVNIIEDGDILTEVESFFECGASFVRILSNRGRLYFAPGE